MKDTININFLSPLEYKFTLARAPITDFYIQATNIPGLSLPSADIPTPFIKMPLIGDHINYSMFWFTFKVDYRMQNYLELYTWLQAIGKPDSFAQSQTIGSDSRRVQQQKEMDNTGRYSDGIMSVLDGQHQPLLAIHYKDLCPVALSDLIMDTRKQVQYIECTAQFKFQSFDITSLVE